MFIPIRTGMIALDGSAVPVDFQDSTTPEETGLLILDQCDLTFMLYRISDGTVQVLTAPAESYVLEQLKDADTVRVHEALSHFKRELATQLESDLMSVVTSGVKEEQGEYKVDPASQGKCALHNVALDLLAPLKKDEVYMICLETVRTGRPRRRYRNGRTTPTSIDNIRNSCASSFVRVDSVIVYRRCPTALSH